jgi:hypothetical protein
MEVAVWAASIVMLAALVAVADEWLGAISVVQVVAGAVCPLSQQAAG